MPFSRSKNDWIFFRKTWNPIPASLLSSDLSQKSTFLFSSWREYFNLVLCEKNDLAARSQQIQLSQVFLSFRPIGKLRLFPWSVLHSEPLTYQVTKSNRILCLTAQTFLHKKGSIKSFLMLTFSSNCIDFISRTWGFAVDFSLKRYRLVLSRDIRRLEKDGLLLQTGTENLPKILLGAYSSHLKPPWLRYLCVQVRQGSDLFFSLYMLFPLCFISRSEIKAWLQG